MEAIGKTGASRDGKPVVIGKTGTAGEVEFKMSDLRKKKAKATGKKNIKDELAKLRTLKAKYSRKMTVARIKAMKGFEDISDELARQIIKQLEEYAGIVLTQMNRLSLTRK